MSDEPRFACPHCGGEEIQEANVAYAWLTVTRWEADGSISDIDGNAAMFPEWETVDTPERFRCAGCRKTFAEPVSVGEVGA